MSNTIPDTPGTYLKDQLEKQYGAQRVQLQSQALDHAIQPLRLDRLPNRRLDELEKLLLYKNFDQLQAALDMGFVSVVETCQFFLNRATALNPSYRAILAINPNCLEAARKIDERLAEGEMITGLMGIPLWLKDNIADADPMPTTGGALYLKDSFPKTDAAIVQRLKDAGAIILGKANLSEWANFMTTDSSNGFSALGGQVWNPYGSFDVGGSSAGSAVAVALGLAPAAIGTETCGSLVYPASQNGIVTFKPTRGSLPLAGIIPISHHFDTPGPMTMTVPDAYALTVAMAGPIPGPEPDFIHASLHGKRIGLALSEALDSELRQGDLESLYRIKTELCALGAEVITVNLPPSLYEVPLLEALLQDFKEDLRAYFQWHGQPASLEAVVRYNQEDPPNRAPYGQDLLESGLHRQREGSAIDTAAMIATTQADLTAIFDAHGLDLLYNLSNYLAVPHAVAGFPAITVPTAQRNSGEPVGVTFVSRPESLTALFESAHCYCIETRHFQPPVL